MNHANFSEAVAPAGAASSWVKVAVPHGPPRGATYKLELSPCEVSMSSVARTFVTCLAAVVGCGGSTGTQTVPGPPTASAKQDVRPSDGFPDIIPTLLTPPNGAEFDHYPRILTLRWTPEPLAASYIVELQIQGSSRDWHLIPDPARQSVTADSVQIQFNGAQPGRWRVIAIDATGVASSPSDWWEFFFGRWQ